METDVGVNWACSGLGAEDTGLHLGILQQFLMHPGPQVLCSSCLRVLAAYMSHQQCHAAYPVCMSSPS
jgi:hypothetical protein